MTEDMAAAVLKDRARRWVCRSGRGARARTACGATSSRTTSPSRPRTRDGASFSLKARFSGCESYVVVPDSIVIASNDPGSIFGADLDLLVEKSPPNVHYFFVSRKSDAAAIEESLALVRAQRDAVLASLPDGEEPGQRGWWRRRLHLVKGSGRTIAGWLGALLRLTGTAATTGSGVAIDRFQRLARARQSGRRDALRRGAAAGQGVAVGQQPLVRGAPAHLFSTTRRSARARLAAQTGVTEVTLYDHEVVGGTVTRGDHAARRGGARGDGHA